MKKSQNISAINLFIIALLLAIASCYISYNLGKNSVKIPVDSNTSIVASKNTDNAVVLSKGVESTSGGGAILTGQVKNKLETPSKITLVGSFNSIDNNEIASANTTIEIPGSTTANYSISFGPEVAGFAGYDVKVTEVNN